MEEGFFKSLFKLFWLHTQPAWLLFPCPSTSILLPLERRLWIVSISLSSLHTKLLSPKLLSDCQPITNQSLVGTDIVHFRVFLGETVKKENMVVHPRFFLKLLFTNTMGYMLI